MTVTPVANWPSAWRKSVAVRGVAVIFGVFEDIILRARWEKAASIVAVRLSFGEPLHFAPLQSKHYKQKR